MSDWQLYYDDGNTKENSLYRLKVIDSYSRFARQAKASVIDPDGTKQSNYLKGESIVLKVKTPSDSTFTERFTGFVIDTERDETLTHLDILSHDFWLKRRQVFSSYSSKTLSYILEDLITEYTPLTWNSNNISIANDTTITRTWKGERLDEVIAEIASISGYEYFGANNNKEFFFRERQFEEAGVNFTEQDFYDAKFKNINKDKINRVNLYYGEDPNRGLVVVQDREDQLELQKILDYDRPVVRQESFEFPEITTEDQAKRKAKKILAGKSLEPVEGEFWIYDNDKIEPGEVTHISSEYHNIDDDFVIAEIKMNYPSSETRLKLAENRAGINDTLLDMNNDITRIDLKHADIDATPTEIASISNNVYVKTTVSAWRYEFDNDYFRFGVFGGTVGGEEIGGKLGDPRKSKELVFRRSD